MRHDFGSWTFTASSNNLIGCAGTRRSGAADHHPRRSPHDPSRGQAAVQRRWPRGGDRRTARRLGGRITSNRSCSSRGTRCKARSAFPDHDVPFAAHLDVGRPSRVVQHRPPPSARAQRQGAMQFSRRLGIGRELPDLLQGIWRCPLRCDHQPSCALRGDVLGISDFSWPPEPGAVSPRYCPLQCRPLPNQLSLVLS